MNKEEIIKNVEQRVKNELSKKCNPDMLGYIHIFESRKKEILEKDYNIKIKTSTEKNPSCSID